MIQFTARLGFVVVVLLALVGISSAVGRLAATVQYLADPTVRPSQTADPAPGFEPPPRFNARYYDHPYLTLVHVVSGIVFMVLGPLQFVAAIRRRWIGFHRWCGRIFLVAGLVGATSALIFVLVLPVFGTLTASVAVASGSLLFLVAIGQGYRHVRRFEIAEHREWMIRAFAIGLGISTFRVLIPILIALFGVSFAEAWDTVAWLGFVINLSVAELWIHATRREASVGPSRSRPSSVPTVENVG